MKRDLIDIGDLSQNEIAQLLDMTHILKKNKGQRTNELQGKSIALVFQKPSNRTRVSFEVGIWQLGGNCIYLSPDEINLGKRESSYDVAKTLSRYIDAIVTRTHSHQDVIDMAKYASVPIINGLSDMFHPCQALADLFSIQERFGKLKGLELAFIGDGNNVCHSLLLGCAKVGLNIAIATPKGYAPLASVVKKAQAYAKRSGAKITLGNSPVTAVKGAHIIYSDTWVSMGQEAESKKRLKDFEGFQVSGKLVKAADKNFVFMHCLPAHRGQEVTVDVIDGKHSIIFDQAENRMHVQKAILISLLNSKG